MIVYAVVDDARPPDFPLGVELDVLVRREDAERFIEEVRGDDPKLAGHLRIEEREARGGAGARTFRRRQLRVSARRCPTMSSAGSAQVALLLVLGLVLR